MLNPLVIHQILRHIRHKLIRVVKKHLAIPGPRLMVKLNLLSIRQIKKNILRIPLRILLINHRLIPLHIFIIVKPANMLLDIPSHLHLAKLLKRMARVREAQILITHLPLLAFRRLQIVPRHNRRLKLVLHMVQNFVRNKLPSDIVLLHIFLQNISIVNRRGIRRLRPCVQNQRGRPSRRKTG